VEGSSASRRREPSSSDTLFTGLLTVTPDQFSLSPPAAPTNGQSRLSSTGPRSDSWLLVTPEHLRCLSIPHQSHLLASRTSNQPGSPAYRRLVPVLTSPGCWSLPSTFATPPSGPPTRFTWNVQQSRLSSTGPRSDVPGCWSLPSTFAPLIDVSTWVFNVSRGTSNQRVERNGIRAQNDDQSRPSSADLSLVAGGEIGVVFGALG